MAATPQEVVDPEVENVAWDLSPLTDGEGAAGVERQLAEADQRATAFAEKRRPEWRGR